MAQTPALNMTEAQWSERVGAVPGSERAPRSPLLIVVPVILGVSVAAMLGFLWFRYTAPVAPSAATSHVTESPPVATSAPESQAGAPAPAPYPPSATPMPPPTATAESPADASTSETPPKASRAVAPSRPAAPKCKTVSYFDSEGTKRFKVECK
jgi:hypothetical protein